MSIQCKGEKRPVPRGGASFWRAFNARYQTRKRTIFSAECSILLTHTPKHQIESAYQAYSESSSLPAAPTKSKSVLSDSG